MYAVKRIHTLPENCESFIDEIAEGLAGLYGKPAGEAYRRKAYPMLEATVDFPAAETWACMEGPRAAALLITVLRNGFGQISYIHVLRSHAGCGEETQLYAQAVESLQARGAQAIVCECLPLCPLDLDACAAVLHFHAVPRLLMQASLDSLALAAPKRIQSKPITRRDWKDVASLISEAYQNHMDRILHREVSSAESALQFVEGALLGRYGPADASFCRMIRREDQAAGAVFGCEIAPGIGFVLQAVVRPEFQGQGIGGQLLCEQAEWFRRAGMFRAALGVTAANPALRLYQRLGYSLLHPVTAYAWHQNQTADEGPLHVLE